MALQELQGEVSTLSDHVIHSRVTVFFLSAEQRVQPGSRSCLLVGAPWAAHGDLRPYKHEQPLHRHRGRLRLPDRHQRAAPHKRCSRMRKDKHPHRHEQPLQRHGWHIKLPDRHQRGAPRKRYGRIRWCPGLRWSSLV